MAPTPMTAQPDGWQHQADHLTLTHTAVGLAAMVVAGKVRRRPALTLVTRPPQTVGAETERGLDTSKNEIAAERESRAKLAVRNSALARAKKSIEFLVERVAQLEQQVSREAPAVPILNKHLKTPVAQAPNAQIAELEDELGVVREGLIHWQNENFSLQLSLDLVVSENSRLVHCLTESDAAAAEKRVLEGELGSARAGLTHWQNENRSLRGSLELIISENARLTRRLMESEAAAAVRRVLEGELRAAREGLLQSQNENRSVRASLDLVVSDNSRLFRRVTDSDNAADRARCQLEQIKTALTITLTKAQVEYNNLVAAANEEKKKRQAEIDAVNTCLEAMSSRVVTAEKLLEEARQSWLVHIGESSEAERNVADVTGARDAAINKLKLLQNWLQIKEGEAQDHERARLRAVESSNASPKGFKTHAAALARAKKRISFLADRVAQLEAEARLAENKNKIDERNSPPQLELIERVFVEDARQKVQANFAKPLCELNACVGHNCKYSGEAQLLSTETLLANTITF
jgi:hypothetical protein